MTYDTSKKITEEDIDVFFDMDGTVHVFCEEIKQQILRNQEIQRTTRYIKLKKS